MTKGQRDRIKAGLARYTEKATASPEAARATLVREGIYLPDGTLSPNYRDASALSQG